MFSVKNGLAGALTVLAVLIGASARAGDVLVKVTGVNSTQGQIGCALFENSPAFPMDSTNAKQIWQAADAGGVVCKFTAVAPGTYAVSIAHDLNGNKKVDTNFLGIPKEGWGVSNNVVPSMRSPKFDEAKFQVKDAANTEIEIKFVY